MSVTRDFGFRFFRGYIHNDVIFVFKNRRASTVKPTSITHRTSSGIHPQFDMNYMRQIRLIPQTNEEFFRQISNQE